jgi:hypothetical protein
MGQLWLPKEQGERYLIIKRLKEINVFVAGHQYLETAHLRDILQAQEEGGRVPIKPFVPQQTIPKEAIVQELKAVKRHIEERQAGRRKFY